MHIRAIFRACGENVKDIDVFNKRIMPPYYLV